MGDGNLRPRKNPHALTDYQKIRYRWLRRRSLRLCQIWCKSAHGGLQGKWVKYNEFFYLYFFGTHLQVRPVDGFSRLMTLMTRPRERVCFLGVSLILRPIVGVKFPQNLNFGGVNRLFGPKTGKILRVSYYRNCCIDFNQILHNDRDHQVVRQLN